MYHKFEVSSILRTLLAFPRVPYYTYKPLTGPHDAIRLILIQPALYLTSPISCRVIETSWGYEQAQGNESKGYSALSYTWGDTSLKSLIEIDGRQFHVTKNLELALRHLRSQRSLVRLWADSLCINQKDLEERNQHVSQMREIYSAARKTIIFLGEASEGSDLLLTAINAAGTSISKATTRNAVVKSLVNASGMRKAELQREAFNILWRPYWTRIWIFQEIVVSANPWIQCGNMLVSWELFCQALIALLGFDMKGSLWGSGYSNAPRQRLEDVYWERRAYRLSHHVTHVEPSPTWDMGSSYNHEAGTGLLDLLVSKRGSQATDSRDMVFAVSGIATKPKAGNPMGITYEKSPALVYMDVVKYLLESYNSYEVLSHAGKRPDDSKKSSKFPSWAPDWRVTSQYKTRILDWIDAPTSATPLHTVRNSHTYHESHGLLACVGESKFTLSSVSVDTTEITPSASSIGRVIWSKQHRRKLHEHGIKTRLGSVHNLIAQSHPLTYKRRVASTKGGTLCLVPQDAKEGDLIVVFDGGVVPFVLRPLPQDQLMANGVKAVSLWSRIRSWIYGPRLLALENEEKSKMIESEITRALKEKNTNARVVGHFLLIGECFVDGLMQGRNREPSPKSDAIFVLH